MIDFKSFLGFKELKEWFIDSEKLIVILQIGIVFLIVYWVFMFLVYLLFRTVLQLKHFHFQKNRLETIRKTINLILRWLFIAAFFITILQNLNFNLNALLASAGFLGAALVLIFQNSLRDLFVGWIFAFEDVFRHGEELVINNTFKGKVYNITSRYLILKSEDNSIFYIPFGKIDFIQNLSRNKSNDIDDIVKTE
jgi:small-conductance mechanosensitive channel